MATLRPAGHQLPPLAAQTHDAAEALASLWTRSTHGVAHRVSPSQLRALLCISRAGTTNLTQLAESLGAMLSSASRLCERLAAAGLVERNPSTVNRRELTLSLTGEGARLLAELDRQRQADIAQVLARMPAEAQRALVTGLEAFSAAAQGDAHHASSQSQSC